MVFTKEQQQAYYLKQKELKKKTIVLDNPVTIEIQIINEYKKCLALQLTHNNFMKWLTLNNLVNTELIELYEPYLFKKEWNFRMKPCLKSVIEWAK